MTPPPRWSHERLWQDLNAAQELFRHARMEEPLQAYMAAFDNFHARYEDLLNATGGLAGIQASALEILTNPELLEAFRYVSGPPISVDDLKTLSQSTLAPSRLHADPEIVEHIVEIVMTGLDKRRFPWVSEGRQATDSERAAAILASAALMAVSRVNADRRNEGKQAQEEFVEQSLADIHLKQVEPRKIPTLNMAPGPGEFCRESVLGERKADFVIGLWDHRVAAMECKVSNSSTNSVKRLNNDACVKAEVWYTDFGTKQIVPAAVLSGVYKIHNLENAQTRGLTIFWSHAIGELTNWIQATKP